MRFKQPFQIDHFLNSENGFVELIWVKKVWQSEEKGARLYHLNIGNLVAAIPYHLAHCVEPPPRHPAPESHIVLGKLRAEGGWGVPHPPAFLKIASHKFPHVVTK